MVNNKNRFLINLTSLMASIIFMINGVFAAGKNGNAVENLLGPLGTIADPLSKILQDASALYGLYLITFIIAVYTILKLITNKGSIQGKASTWISVAVTVFIVGRIFYQKDIKEVVTMFHGFANFVVYLMLSVTLIFLAVNGYKKNKTNNPNLAKVYLFGGLYLASFMMLPQFNFTEGSVAGAARNFSPWLSTIATKSYTVGGSFAIIGNILSIVNIISFWPLIIYGGKMLLGLFSGTKTGVTRVDIDSATKEFNGITRDLMEDITQGREYIQTLERLIN